MTREYYAERIADFIYQEPDRILGKLAREHQFEVDDLQKNAWIEQIRILQSCLNTFQQGYIVFEYSIPRMGKRVDVVLLISGVVIVLEFKVGDTQYAKTAIDQVMDYALDLKNFHERSHQKLLVPVVVATEAKTIDNNLTPYADGTFAPLKANKSNLQYVIEQIINTVQADDFDPIEWKNSRYKPTPTIIEAAQALYRGHNVTEISRSDSGATNLSSTTEAISEIIEHAKQTNQKTICFVTGVPGAGKTLAGLNIANERLKVGKDEHAVFLSGNGPLVKVLREALARSEMGNPRRTGDTKPTKKAALTEAQTFIQNIHHFRDDALSTKSPPIEKVVVFDEAQRAWTREQTASFMKRKRNQLNFSMSEPQFLISILDRHADWAVIICLVGGGQEINTGEAGMLEWFDALRAGYPDWLVCFSPNLSDDEYTGGMQINEYFDPQRVRVDPRLHLAVSLRSFRAESVSGLIKAILDNQLEDARLHYQVVAAKYPIMLTRDIGKAKIWLRNTARGTERFGLLTSSGAIRLRSIGINVKVEIDVENWFLNDKDDVRSSYYLEEVATEFDIQGLELDWTCVVWDADLRYGHHGWEYRSFKGTKWQVIKDDLRKKYLRNTYRVLLTRARQGMVIVVPEGDKDDHTREPSFYNRTYHYLREIGLEEL